MRYFIVEFEVEAGDTTERILAVVQADSPGNAIDRAMAATPGRVSRDYDIKVSELSLVLLDHPHLRA